LLGLRPAPEFEAWLESVGILSQGRLTDRAGSGTTSLSLLGAFPELGS
jgi:ethanolamine ammonia-lyase large subunit